MFPHLSANDTISISRLGKPVRMPPFWATLIITVPKNMSFWKLFHELEKHYPLIIYVDPPLVIEYDSVPNDSLFLDQYSIFDTVTPEQTINVEPAWDIETGKRHIKVAIHDSGIDWLHEDLDVLTGYSYDGNYLYDSLGATNLVLNTQVDENGHGTSVAGIIGARRNNNIGISGIAGGNGVDTSGVSLICLRLGDPMTGGNSVAISVIDAARSVGTYEDWTSGATVLPNEEFHWSNAAGYGVHIGNHSYSLTVLAEAVGNELEGKDIDITDTLNWELTSETEQCNLCREAFLFSLQNGVTNVASRGNNTNPFDLTSPNSSNAYPRSFDDSWIITVGASGTDGNRLFAPFNTGSSEIWYSPIGKNIDVIAPGSRASVGTTRSYHYPATDDFGAYRRFNGTSASTPHVSGVAALLLSYWNKPCYSNLNLDPADIEYILQRSAVDVNLNVNGYDDSTGWGRLDALAALKMIEFPTYQIVHPEEMYVQSNVLEIDTISFRVEEPINPAYNGPLASTFPIELEWLYRVERIKQELTYNFANYKTPTNELLDVWYRASETNSLGMVVDTFTNFNVPPQVTPPVISDSLRIEPKAELIGYTDTTVTFTGYYYHFIGKYDVFNDVTSVVLPINFWYPINPAIDTMKMAYSIYLKDTTTFSVQWDFPCYAENTLFDSIVSTESIAWNNFEIFPNPGQNYLNIKIQTLAHGKVQLYDISGSLVDEIPIETTQQVYQLSMRNLMAGMYFVHFVTDRGSVTKKWIKQ